MGRNEIYVVTQISMKLSITFTLILFAINTSKALKCYIPDITLSGENKVNEHESEREYECSNTFKNPFCARMVNEAKNQNIASYCYDLVSDMTKNGCYNTEELKKDAFVVDVDVMGILASSSGGTNHMSNWKTGNLCFCNTKLCNTQDMVSNAAKTEKAVSSKYPATSTKNPASNNAFKYTINMMILPTII